MTPILILAGLTVKEMLRRRLFVLSLLAALLFFLASLMPTLFGARDVTIDATGRPEVWQQAMDAVGRGGSVVFFGGCAPGTSISVDTRRAHYEELALLGAFHHTPELIRRAVELLEGNAVEPECLITHRRGLGGVREALELMATGQTLKVLIEPASRQS